MPITRKTVARGSGITQHDVSQTWVTAPVNKGDQQAIAGELGRVSSVSFVDGRGNTITVSPRREFSSDADKIESIARQILRKHGINSPTVRSDGRSITGWQAVTQAQGFESDSSPDYAARVLDTIDIARAYLRAGDSEAAAYFALKLGALVTQTEMKTRWEPEVERGRKFRSHGKGQNALTRLIQEALVSLGKRASTADVRKWLRDHPGNIVDHIDEDGSIEWHDRNGEHSLDGRSFQNRVSELRKKS